jgi:hypothetical protein
MADCQAVITNYELPLPLINCQLPITSSSPRVTRHELHRPIDAGIFVAQRRI